MKLVKVFDCQDMPDQAYEAFFDLFMDNNAGNDCYVDYWVEQPEEGVEDNKVTSVNDWLLANGANLKEHVIIKHWW